MNTYTSREKVKKTLNHTDLNPRGGSKVKFTYPPNDQNSSRVNRTTKIVALGILGAMVSVVGCIAFWGIKGVGDVEKDSPNVIKPPEINAPNVINPPEINAPKKKYSPLEDVLHETFNCPVYLNVVNKTLYVFDAGDNSLHRFGSGHTVGKYLLKENAGCEEYRQKFSPKNLLKGHVPFKVKDPTVDVDNLDGTITTYGLPELGFLKRKYGKISPDKPGAFLKTINSCVYKCKYNYKQSMINCHPSSSENEYSSSKCAITRYSYPLKEYSSMLEDLENIYYTTTNSISQDLPKSYFLFNDVPSKVKESFKTIVPITNFQPDKVKGHCFLVPVLASYFTKSEEIPPQSLSPQVDPFNCQRNSDISSSAPPPRTGLHTFFGYSCAKDRLEKYVDVNLDFYKVPIAATAYEDTILFLQEGSQKVKKLNINHPGINWR